MSYLNVYSRKLSLMSLRRVNVMEYLNWSYYSKSLRSSSLRKNYSSLKINYLNSQMSLRSWMNCCLRNYLMNSRNWMKNCCLSYLNSSCLNLKSYLKNLNLSYLS